MNGPFISPALLLPRAVTRKRAAPGILGKGTVSISPRGAPCYFRRGIRGAIAAIRTAQAIGGQAFICDGVIAGAATQLWPRCPASYTKRATLTKPDCQLPDYIGAGI